MLFLYRNQFLSDDQPRIHLYQEFLKRLLLLISVKVLAFVLCHHTMQQDPDVISVIPTVRPNIDIGIILIAKTAYLVKYSLF